MGRIHRTLLLAALLLTGGCSILGVFLDKTTGNDKIKARYVFPKRPTLVLAESYGNSGDVEIDANRVTLALNRAFKEHKVAPTVDSDALDRLRDHDPGAYNKMTIDAVGRAVGARQVLYVHILRAEVEVPTGGGAVHGVMDVRIHVVDTASGETLWPTDERDGLLLQTNTPWVTNSPQAQTQVRADMANQMADGIGKLFYDWTPDTNLQADQAQDQSQ